MRAPHYDYEEDQSPHHPLAMHDSDEEDSLGQAESLTNSICSRGSGEYERGGVHNNPIPVHEFTAYINRVKQVGTSRCAVRMIISLIV